MVKKVMITEKCYKNKIIEEMVEKDIKKPKLSYSFTKHMFVAQWQNLQFRQIKANISAGSVLQVVDVAKKNRDIRYQRCVLLIAPSHNASSSDLLPV